MKLHSILAFAAGTAPHDMARQMMRFTCDTTDFDGWLQDVAGATNHEARKRGLLHVPDIAEPPERSACYDFIDVLSDEELAQQQTWIAQICSVA